MNAWRICKAKYAAAALSGEGTRLFAGRWNPAGVRMVYCSASLSLAALEFFVPVDPSVAPDDPVSIRVGIPDELSVERLDTAALPADWRVSASLAARTVGAEWLAAQRSSVLLVPSVVIDGEWNVLLNPAHGEFTRVMVGEPKPFVFDERMFGR